MKVSTSGQQESGNQMDKNNDKLDETYDEVFEEGQDEISKTPGFSASSNPIQPHQKAPVKVISHYQIRLPKSIKYSNLYYFFQ